MKTFSVNFTEEELMCISEDVGHAHDVKGLFTKFRKTRPQLLDKVTRHITPVQGDAERGGFCEHMDKCGTFCHQIGDVVQDRTP